MCVAARAESRDARTGARTVIETSDRVRGVRGRTGQAGLLPSARPGGCTPGTHKNFYPPSGLWPCGADVRQRPAQARASARRSKARIDSGGTPPVRGRTGQAAFLRSAKAGRSQKIYRRGREPANRSSAAFSRRSRARLAQSEHGRLEIRKGSRMEKSQCLCGFQNLTQGSRTNASSCHS